jgi:hypothetical protein
MSRTDSLVLGALIGGALMWVFEQDFRRIMDDRTWRMRRRTADALARVAAGLDSARVRIESGFSGGPVGA